MKTLIITVVALLVSGLALAQEQEDIDFGEDLGDYAFDGQCDDSRFVGDRVVLHLLPRILADASDCRDLFSQDLIRLREELTYKRALELAAQAPTINTQRLAQLDAFQIDESTLPDFTALGWRVEEAFLGMLSVVGMEIGAGGSERTYTVGMWDIPLEALTEEKVSGLRVEQTLWDENAHDGLLLFFNQSVLVTPDESPPIIVCRLHFSSGPLVSKVCEGSAYEDEE